MPCLRRVDRAAQLRGLIGAGDGRIGFVVVRGAPAQEREQQKAAESDPTGLRRRQAVVELQRESAYSFFPALSPQQQ